MTGAHQLTPAPCPSWCQVAVHGVEVAPGGIVTHSTTPIEVANISIFVLQMWGPDAGWMLPLVSVSRIGSERSVTLSQPEAIRALAELFDSTNGALHLRRYLYEFADYFARIHADYLARSVQ